MEYRFKKHYTREEARALLPSVREWLRDLAQLSDQMEQQGNRLRGLMSPGRDLGGSLVNEWTRTMVDLGRVLREFEKREIQIKDVERGLIDFPAIIDGREVFLCWEKDEDDIEFWHDLDAGYAGRSRLE